MKLYSIIFIALIAILSFSCDNDDDGNACETTDLTYTNAIATILNANCATAGCHGEGTTFEMHNFATATAAVATETIIGAINHTEGFLPMPYPIGSDKLSDCDIDKITAWIADGAPE